MIIIQKHETDAGLWGLFLFLFSFPLLSILFSRFLTFSLHLLFLSSLFPLLLRLSFFFQTFPFSFLPLVSFLLVPLFLLFFCFLSLSLFFHYITLHFATLYSFLLLSTPFLTFSAPLCFFSHSYPFSCLFLFLSFFLVFKRYLTLLCVYMFCSNWTDIMNLSPAE